MNRVPLWLLPAAMVLLDLAVWPGIPLLRDEPVSPTATAAIIAINLAAAVALLWRRSHPIAAAVAVCVVLSAGAWSLPENAHLVMPFADLIALYSVAVHRARRPTLLLAAATLLWQAVLLGLAEGIDLDFAGGLAVIVVLYLVVIGAGRGRARWHADRAAAATRLAEAEARRAQAAENERHRLARELHDVTAHHLTSIVVTASAAQRLATKRPELAAEAVEFTARTGRETLGALRRLVAILQTPDATPELSELVTGFRALGGTLTLDTPPETLPPSVSEAICGITREALTNTLRYAPSAPVHITVTRAPGSVELTVDDEGSGRADGMPGLRDRAAAGAAEPATNEVGGSADPGGPLGSRRVVAGMRDRAAGATEPAAGEQGEGSADVARTLGSGRGVAGMRERAAALGGTLSAGPRDGGGWRVRAVLPDTPGNPVAGQRPRRAPGGQPGTAGRPVPERQSRSATAIDGVLVALALIGPAAALSELLTDPGLPAAGQVALVVLGAAAHAVPLWWRRSRPWTVLGVVAATVWVWPALIAAGLLPTGVAWLVLAGCAADLMAVYAVARYGRRPHLDWLAMPAGTAALAAAAGTAAALQPPPDGEPRPAFLVMLLVTAALAAIGLLAPVPAVWVLGYLVRGRRERLQQREDHAIAASTFWAHNTAWAERSRVAAGLRAAVLRHTEAMVAAAGTADLDGVLDSARAALDAMRGLLNGLRDDGRPDARDPQPTLAAVGALADRWRSGGRDLDVEVLAAGQALPADVDVSAYRVVELLLAADTGRATLRVDAGSDPVRISITPAPADPDGEIGAGLRARAAAVGGEVAVTPDGLEIRLLARAGEVASSPSR